MTKQNGYIKLFRSFLEWEWYQDIPAKTVFLHLLLSANYEDKPWKGIVVHRGEIVTSYDKISEKTGLSYQQTRSAVKKLKSTGDITQYATHRYSLIRIENFEKYQGTKTDCETVWQQSESLKMNSQSTATKEIKKKEYSKEVEIKENFCVPPEIAEAFAGYIEMRKKKKNPLTERAEKLLLNRLEKLAPYDYDAQNKLLDEATLKGWQSVYDSKDKPQNGGGKRGYGQADKRLGFDGNFVDTMSAVVI